MRGTVVLLTLFSFGAASAPDLQGQSCTPLPHQPGEFWLAAGALQEGSTRWDEVGLEISPGNRFAIGFQRTTGGFEGDQDLESWAVRVGVPFTARPARFCLFGGLELNDFSFLERFDMDRGEAEYLAREIGVRGELPLVIGDGLEVSLWLAPSATFLWFDLRGRTLIAGDEVVTEETHRGGNQWKLSGQAGLAIRWKRLGISGGITKRPALSTGTMVFLRLGLVLLRGGGTG